MPRHIMENIPGYDDRVELKEMRSDKKNVAIFSRHCSEDLSDDIVLRGITADLKPFGVHVFPMKQADGTTNVAICYNKAVLLSNLTHATGRKQKVWDTGYTWGEILKIHAEILADETGTRKMTELYEMTGMPKSTFYSRYHAYSTAMVSEDAPFR